MVEILSTKLNRFVHYCVIKTALEINFVMSLRSKNIKINNWACLNHRAKYRYRLKYSNSINIHFWESIIYQICYVYFIQNWRRVIDTFKNFSKNVEETNAKLCTWQKAIAYCFKPNGVIRYSPWISFKIIVSPFQAIPT